MTTDPTAQPTPTPAPVAAPEGGWREVVSQLRQDIDDSNDARYGTLSTSLVAHALDQIEADLAPREDAPRPEPTPQKVHVGVERDTEMGGVSCSECGWHLAGRDTLEAGVMEERQRQHDEHHTPRPEPVAVPEGGWRDGDWLALIDGRVWHVSDDALLHDERGRIMDADYVFRRGYVVYVHAPREAYGEPNDTTQHAPRPEPVTAPLPSEAITDEAVEAAAREQWRREHGRISSHDHSRTPESDERESAEDGYRQWDRSVSSAVKEGYRRRARAALTAALPHLISAADQRARDEGTVRALDVLSVAREQIRARRIHFRELGADHQYLSAMDDAFGLVSNLWRAHGGEGR